MNYEAYLVFRYINSKALTGRIGSDIRAVVRIVDILVVVEIE